MKQEEKKTLQIHLEGEEIDTFKSMVKKISQQADKVGFGSLGINDKEKDLIKELEK